MGPFSIKTVADSRQMNITGAAKLQPLERKIPFSSWDMMVNTRMDFASRIIEKYERSGKYFFSGISLTYFMQDNETATDNEEENPLYTSIRLLLTLNYQRLYQSKSDIRQDTLNNIYKLLDNNINQLKIYSNSGYINILKIYELISSDINITDRENIQNMLQLQLNKHVYHGKDALNETQIQIINSLNSIKKDTLINKSGNYTFGTAPVDNTASTDSIAGRLRSDVESALTEAVRLVDFKWQKSMKKPAVMLGKAIDIRVFKGAEKTETKPQMAAKSSSGLTTWPTAGSEMISLRSLRKTAEEGIKSDIHSAKTFGLTESAPKADTADIRLLKKVSDVTNKAGLQAENPKISIKQSMAEAAARFRQNDFEKLTIAKEAAQKQFEKISQQETARQEDREKAQKKETQQIAEIQDSRQKARDASAIRIEQELKLKQEKLNRLSEQENKRLTAKEKERIKAAAEKEKELPVKQKKLNVNKTDRTVVQEEKELTAKDETFEKAAAEEERKLKIKQKELNRTAAYEEKELTAKDEERKKAAAQKQKEELDKAVPQNEEEPAYNQESLLKSTAAQPVSEEASETDDIYALNGFILPPDNAELIIDTELVHRNLNKANEAYDANLRIPEKVSPTDRDNINIQKKNGINAGKSNETDTVKKDGIYLTDNEAAYVLSDVFKIISLKNISTFQSKSGNTDAHVPYSIISIRPDGMSKAVYYTVTKPILSLITLQGHNSADPHEGKLDILYGHNYSYNTFSLLYLNDISLMRKQNRILQANNIERHVKNKISDLLTDGNILYNKEIYKKLAEVFTDTIQYKDNTEPAAGFKKDNEPAVRKLINNIKNAGSEHLIKVIEILNEYPVYRREVELVINRQYEKTINGIYPLFERNALFENNVLSGSKLTFVRNSSFGNIYLPESSFTFERSLKNLSFAGSLTLKNTASLKNRNFYTSISVNKTKFEQRHYILKTRQQLKEAVMKLDFGDIRKLYKFINDNRLLLQSRTKTGFTEDLPDLSELDMLDLTQADYENLVHIPAQSESKKAQLIEDTGIQTKTIIQNAKTEFRMAVMELVRHSKTAGSLRFRNILTDGSHKEFAKALVNYISVYREGLLNIISNAQVTELEPFIEAVSNEAGISSIFKQNNKLYSINEKQLSMTLKPAYISFLYNKDGSGAMRLLNMKTITGPGIEDTGISRFTRNRIITLTSNITSDSAVTKDLSDTKALNDLNRSGSIYDIKLKHKEEQKERQKEASIRKIIDEYITVEKAEINYKYNRVSETINEISRQKKEIKILKDNIQKQNLLVEELKKKIANTDNSNKVDVSRLTKDILRQMQMDIKMARMRKGLD